MAWNKVREPYKYFYSWASYQSSILVCINLFLSSIIFKSLRLCPISCTIPSGNAFGNGIYTTNVADKSLSYTANLEKGSRYLLLCDVSLGKVRKEKTWSSTTYPPNSYDTVWACSKVQPGNNNDLVNDFSTQII